MTSFDLSWRLLALVVIGGALGTLARVLVSGLAPEPDPFPWPTYVVNVSGGFLLALFMFGAVARGNVSPELRMAVGVAFLGAYTTMSTYAFDTVVLWERAGMGWAALNAVINPGSTLLGVLVGRALSVGWA